MAQNQDALPLVINRTAVDPAGRLGTLYDIRQDLILEKLDITFEKAEDQFPQQARCVIENGDKNPNRNLLELIGIDEGLRLSLLLGFPPRNGISKVINRPHIIDKYTRVFHYTYIYREERFPDDEETVRAWLQAIMPETNATHIITGVSWGVDIVVVLQLSPQDDIVKMIDNTLEKYRAYLNGDRNDFKLTRDDIHICGQIIDTTIYSNIPISTNYTTLHEIFHNISQLKTNDIEHQQVNYILFPLQLFYSQSPRSNYNYNSFYSTNNTQLEKYLLELFSLLKILEAYFNEDMSNLLCGHFKDRLTNAYQQWPHIQAEHNDLIKRFSALVTETRSGLLPISIINEELENEKQIRIRDNIYNLYRNIADLYAKGRLISDLGNQQIQYCNVVERHVDENDNEDTLKRKLIIDKTSDRILCSNDTLNINNPEQLQELTRALVEELARNSKLRLTYADFSYCTFKLPNMIILPFSKYYIKKKSKNQELLSTTDINTSISSFSTTHISVSPTSSSPTAESINILLLGETGVGKSTFINAIANYLSFNTIDKAQSDKPIVAIPVSFHLGEHLVKFDDNGNSNNEDFNHPGQSVTQHCKSYVVHLNPNDKRKLRIIDTPGFGDTRGLEQDDLNMQHILEYIKRLPHLNAICILLKSNESKVNIFFQSCLTQLFDFFGSRIRRNIIFCFTNARSTSYTPGNAYLLLQDTISSLSIGKIPLKKKNTFCFDNESFRYLVALQNKISFNDQDKEEYEISWTNSVIEASRLIRYIRKNLLAYPIPNEWEAIKRAQIEIVQMIHPILETMRHILRNIIIRKINSSKVSIETHSNGVSFNEKQTDSYHRQSLPHQPIPIDFLEDFKITNCPLDQKQDDMIDQLALLCHVSAEFGHFLAHCTPYPNGNPFLSGLFRLTKEEENTCDDHNRSYMNMQLIEGLKSLTRTYEERMQTFKSNTKSKTLSDIHEWIKYMHEYPLVSDYVTGNNRANMSFDSETILL